jgi:hypothetical protein
MKRALLTLLCLLTFAGGVAADEPLSPHHMTKPNGEIDMEKCAVCHEPDMSLSRSKLETCTLCHSETLHSGATQHVHASAKSVTQLLAVHKNESPALPLTDEGQIYCGTCHIFHDPAVGGDELLAHATTPPSTGLAEAVREALKSKWAKIAEKYDESNVGAQFATHGTRALRLPVADGSLCRHCHGNGP